MVLACLLLALLTFAIWSFQVNGGRVDAMEMTAIEPQNSLLPRIMQSPTIMLATIIAEFTVLLAITLALAPPVWWLRVARNIGTDANEPTTPLQWLGHKIASSKAPANDQMQHDAAGQPVYYEGAPIPETVANHNGALPNQQVGVPPQPGQPVPGQMQPAQPVLGQPGQPVPAQAQPGQPIPGQPGQPIPAQAQPGQPGQVSPTPTDAANPIAPLVPPAPLSDVLNFEDAPEDDPLADLANIGDILPSAFDEDEGIDPDREALSRSLDDIDIMAMLKDSHNILATFYQ